MSFINWLTFRFSNLKDFVKGKLSPLMQSQENVKRKIFFENLYLYGHSRDEIVGSKFNKKKNLVCL